jgi:predicted DNA-binding transcriptional regulator AlpA
MSTVLDALAALPERPRKSMVAQVLGVSARTVEALVRLGQLPQPLRLGSNIVVFDRGEVIEHVRRLQGQEAVCAS